jgi:transposase
MEQINKEISETKTGTQYSLETKVILTKSVDKTGHVTLTKKFQDGLEISASKLGNARSLRIGIKHAAKGIDDDAELPYETWEGDKKFFRECLEKFLEASKSKYIEISQEEVNEVNRRIELLKQAEVLGETPACRIAGVSVSRVYYYRKLYQKKSGEFVPNYDKSRKRSPKLKVSEDIEKIVVDMIIKNPWIGEIEISKKLKEQGINLSHTTVYNIRNRNNLTNIDDRLRLSGWECDDCKYRLLKLVKELDNKVTEACRIMGYGRHTYYYYLKSYNENNGKIILDPTKVQNCKRPKKTIEDIIIKMSVQKPAWSPEQISKKLEKQGITVSAKAVKAVLKVNNKSK